MLSEKITALRRQNGWSQEELADKLDVSRQAVSKWESAQSTPDVERIVQLAELFAVSTDYLLRDGVNMLAAETAMEPVQEDELPADDASGNVPEGDDAAKKVSLADAADFLQLSWNNSVKIAAGVLLCVLSPVLLILLSGLEEADRMPEAKAAAIGLIVLLAFVAAAVALFVVSGFKGQKYEYLEKEYIKIDAETSHMVETRRTEYRPSYIRANIIAACLCVLSPVPIFLGMMWQREFLMPVMVCGTLVLAGLGAALFVLGGVKWSAMQKLLQEGDYTPFEKRANLLREKIAPVYWIAVTAIYLFWSFTDGDWDETWIIWPVAGVIFAGVMVLCGIIQKNREEKA